MRRPRQRRPLALLVLLGLVALPAVGGGRPAAADASADAEAAYRAALKRPSLYKRMQGRVRLARTGETRVVGIFADDYAKPEEPKDHVRYLLATLAAESLSGAPEAGRAFAGWRERTRDPIDTWLWYRSLGVEHLLGMPTCVEVAQATAQPALFRAAALRVLGDASALDAVPVVATVMAKLPAADPDRAVLVEACAAVARGMASGLKDEATRTLAERIVRTLDDAALPLDTRDIVARHVAALCGTDVVGTSAAPYLRELAAAVDRAVDAPPPEIHYAAGPFFGLRAIGHRVVFVIDASDSMLEPLTEGQRKSLRPTTPSDDTPASRRLGKPASEDDALPWERIKTRFDAAREVLKRSVRALKPEQAFCVILFGDDAKALAATPGLRPADAKTVEAAVGELDRMRPTPTPGDKARPHGKLRGATNLHGGLRLAFRVSTAGAPFGPGEYVNLTRTGCDAVFLLSDGNPTTDDFRKVDRRDGERAIKDREMKEPTADTVDLTFQGPYGDTRFEDFGYLVDDVRRMNLVRQAEIHCVAIGEVDDGLLRSLADAGGGRFRRVEDPAAEAAGK